MDEETRFQAMVGITQALQNFGPTVDAIRVGTFERDAQGRVLAGHGRAVALLAEDISPGDEPGKGRDGQLVPSKHGSDRAGMPFREPEPLRMLVNDVNVPVTIGATKLDVREVREAIV